MSIYARLAVAAARRIHKAGRFAARAGTSLDKHFMQIEILADCAMLGKSGSGGKSVRHDRVCRSVHPVQ
jgi:hypothetical protein